MLRFSRLRDDGGNALIIVVLVSMLVGTLAALTLNTATQADRASASDRNHTIALGVAEAGVHQAIARIEKTVETTFITNTMLDFNGNTEEGTYEVDVQRHLDGFQISSVGRVGGGNGLNRGRRVRVTLLPPEIFPDAGYALFSSTNLYLKNNNEVYAGDIWANDSLWSENGTKIDGSVTSATSWVRLESGTEVNGYVWAGGRKCPETGTCDSTNAWAINHTAGKVTKWVKSSVSAPTCGADANLYNVISTANITEDVTAAGAINAPNAPPTKLHPGECTLAPAAKPPPTFVFNKANYDPATYMECPSAACPGATDAGAAAFNNWLGSHTGGLTGTFVIQDCTNGRIEMNGTQIAGDVTIITNPRPCPGSTNLTGARVKIDGVVDDAVPAGTKAAFVVVSHNRPAPGVVCTDSNDVNCAISAKNHFDASCKTASLIYADNGPVAMKNDTGPNNIPICGSVIAAGIQMKNNLKLTYDPTFERVLGFGPKTFEIAHWEELPVS